MPRNRRSHGISAVREDRSQGLGDRLWALGNRRHLRADDELKPTGVKYDKTLPQFALRWVLSNAIVGTALVGFREPLEVTENLRALGWTISPAQVAEAARLLEEVLPLDPPIQSPARFLPHLVQDAETNSNY